MSRCRSTSFYLNPQTLLYFKDSVLATRDPVTKELVEFSHRRDIAAFEKRHPGWDGICYVARVDKENTLAARLVNSPSDVQLYFLNSRVVEGRTPTGALRSAFLCNRIITQLENSPDASLSVLEAHVEKVGGRRNLLQELFPKAPLAIQEGFMKALDNLDMHRLYTLSCIYQQKLLSAQDIALLLNESVHSPLYFGLVRPELGFSKFLGEGFANLNGKERRELAREYANALLFLDAGTMWTLLSQMANDKKSVDENLFDAILASKNSNIIEALLFYMSELESSLVLRLLEPQYEKYFSAEQDFNNVTKFAPEVLESFKAHKSPSLRIMSARFCALDESLAEWVRKDPNPSVRSAFYQRVFHESVRSDFRRRVLLEAAKDPDIEVKKRLVWNMQADQPEVFMEVAKNAPGSLQAALLANYFAPERVIESILTQPRLPVEVLRRVVATFPLADLPKYFEQVAKYGSPDLLVSMLARYSLALGPYKDDVRSFACTLFKHHNPLVREAALEAAGLRPGEVTKLLKDSPTRYGPWAAGRQDLSKVGWKIVLNARDRKTRTRLLTNVDLPPWVRESVLKTATVGELKSFVQAHQHVPDVIDSIISDDHHYGGEIKKQFEKLVKKKEKEKLERQAEIESYAQRDEQWYARNPVHRDQEETLALLSHQPLKLNYSQPLAESVLVRRHHPELVSSKQVKSLSTLPSLKRIPFKFSPQQIKASGVLEGKILAGYRLRVLNSPQVLLDNAEQMGNCSAGYEFSISQENSLIIRAEKIERMRAGSEIERNIFNIELIYSAQGYKIGEVNSMFNRGSTGSEELIKGLKQFGFRYRQ